MEEQVDRLVQKTWKKFQELPNSKRWLIAVSGIPGSGTLPLSHTSPSPSHLSLSLLPSFSAL